MKERSAWTDMSSAMDRLVVDNDSYLHCKTIENAKLLFKFASSRYIAVTEIGVGYWPTIRIIWTLPSNPIEIEIFEDRYEFYHFVNGSIDVKEVPITQNVVPDELIKLMDATISLDP